ncbi:MAG: secondary thiamine-phosphate synthase enzyme YjbQ [Nanoarchaeota archaeon]|nr:secondary thiamine-phosphate synthase enzyme YjbQ [Nanoarchaeota archaeon]
MQSFTVSTTSRQQIIDINKQVKDIVKDSKIKEGLCLIYIPHTSAAVIINENADPNIMLDIIDALNKVVPQGQWKHDKIDGNGDSHIKSAILGPSETVIIDKGELQLGKWQDILLAEFDGPRIRTVLVKIIGN